MVSKTSWTCPDCCVNPCECRIGPDDHGYEGRPTVTDVCLIPIRDGYAYALVEKSDLHGIEGFTWHLDSHGYPRRRTTSQWIYMHDDIMGDLPEGAMPDHRNRNPLDNRRCNLRALTRSQNAANSPKPANANATSKYKGVSYDHGRSKWVASICHEGKRINLGRFATEDMAAMAYNSAAKLHFGEAAFLNTVHDRIVDGQDASTRKDEGATACHRPGSPPTSPASEAFRKVEEALAINANPRRGTNECIAVAKQALAALPALKPQQPALQSTDLPPAA